MIKIMNEDVLKTQEEFDMVIDSLTNNPKFRRYKDFILYMAELAEEDAEKYDENVYDCFTRLLGFGNPFGRTNSAYYMIEEYRDYYFDIHKTSVQNAAKYIRENLSDNVFDLAHAMGKGVKSGSVEDSINDYLNTLEYPYDELTAEIKNAYIGNSVEEIIQNHTDISNTLINLCNEMNCRQVNRIIGKTVKKLEDAFFNEKQLDEISCEQLQKLCLQIIIFLHQDSTLRKDLFFFDSDEEETEYEFASKVIRAIEDYTSDYNTKFDKEASDMIKKHMTVKDFPLYRIIGYGGSAFDNTNMYGYKKVGDTLYIETSDHKDRLNNMASFTSDVDCEPMKAMQKARGKGTWKIVIMETVGPVYSFNIDRLSSFASNMEHCEFEYFVSGEFEIVDMKDTKDVLWVKIKQLHK